MSIAVACPTCIVQDNSHLWTTLPNQCFRNGTLCPLPKIWAARPWSYLVSAIKLIWRGAPQNEVRGSEATEGVFCLRTKKPFHGTVRTGFFYFIVCLTAYSSRIFAPLIAKAVRFWFPQTRVFRGERPWGNAWDIFRLKSSRVRTCLEYLAVGVLLWRMWWCFEGGEIWSLFSFLNCERTRPTACITSRETIKAGGNVDW